MWNSEKKLQSLVGPYARNKEVAPFISAVDENVKKFYTVDIPSLAIKTYTDKTTACSSIKLLPIDERIYCLNLATDEHILPPRFQGYIPILDEMELAQQKEDWKSLMINLHSSSTLGATSNIMNAQKNTWGKALPTENFWRRQYSLDVCATPGCHQRIPMSKQSDHLNLCDTHHSELNTLLKNYQKTYNIVVPQNMAADDVHNMVYYNLLPSIDRLHQKLLPSTEKHKNYVAQVLLAFKACIYLYRMHLNAMPVFIQTIIGLFLNALKQSETVMKQLVSALLKLLLVPFAICGIFLIWIADLLLSDDLYLSITLLAAGGGLAFWGCAVAAAAGTVLAGPIAAIAGGVALIGIGIAMLIQRLYRRAPHEYVVTANISLNNVSASLRQWLGNAFE